MPVHTSTVSSEIGLTQGFVRRALAPRLLELKPPTYPGRPSAQLSSTSGHGFLRTVDVCTPHTKTLELRIRRPHRVRRILRSSAPPTGNPERSLLEHATIPPSSKTKILGHLPLRIDFPVRSGRRRVGDLIRSNGVPATASLSVRLVEEIFSPAERRVLRYPGK